MTGRRGKGENRSRGGHRSGGAHVTRGGSGIIKMMRPTTEIGAGRFDFRIKYGTGKTGSELRHIDSTSYRSPGQKQFYLPFHIFADLRILLYKPN
mmetsp:Transcript_23810/g.47333  ORF Transcript_23810/g.47333 Transcript_23810/m.47333 type:complete len:95 (-) Transcript_23810:298-582(-)